MILTLPRPGDLCQNTRLGPIQNSLFSTNLASNAVLGSRGNAVFVTGTVNSGKILFNTIVSETLAPGSAVAILSGTVSVIDNIIQKQGIGIEHEPRGTVFENFNLNSGNTQNLSGTISSGGSSFTATPAFLAPALDLYYLLPGSPGIDAGFDVLVTEDVDGQVRPQGAGFDIGFDEGGPRTTALPLVLR